MAEIGRPLRRKSSFWAILLGLAAAATATAATLPAGFTEAQVASGLGSPTAMAFAPDGRLFVTEQGGTLRVIKNGTLLATPFLTVTVNSSGERGLLGVAFDPSFATNNFVYVYYTATTPAIHNRVSRFTANGDTALAGSETVLLDLNNLSGATNHNGGAIHFGPDGKLYIAVGENANSANSQSLSNLLGKVLRINPNGTIPSDNPFFLTAANNNRAIWALGLRNPFTMAFQPGTGRMFINDVGQSTWEEIDDGIAGSNYGWPVNEGPTANPSYRSPIYWYGHGDGNFLGCAITGGTFYNPAVSQFPGSYANVYFFADFCGGWINVLDPANGNAVTGFATGIDAPVDLKVDASGSLYYLARGGSTSGAVYRVDFFRAVAASSRKVHGGTATFDLPLASAPGNPTVEPRSGGAAGGDHTIVFTFNKSVTAGTAAVTEGTAIAGVPTFSGSEMSVPLTGVANEQYVTVTVSNVVATDGTTDGSGSVRVGFLLGDVSQNRVVTLTDLGLVNAQIAQFVTATNYLNDVNTSGTLSVADKGITNTQLTKSLPAP
jgi:glucose/arabinose dehydrogenase